MSIYVKDADGNRKKVAGIGLPGLAGKSAYQYAVDGGFTGTEEQFASLQAGMSNQNLCDNGYFADPVNQRRQTSYSERDYIIDRWILGFSADATASFTIHPGEYSEWSGQGSWLIHRFPDTMLTGKMVTVSVLLYGGTLLSGSAIYNYVNDQNIIVEYFNIPGVMEAYAQSDETEGLWRVVLVNHSTTALKPVAAKFELGSVQTLARKEGDVWVLNDPPPDKAQELLKCQRYFIRSSLIRGTSIVSTQYIPVFFHCLEMRAAPAISVHGSITDGEGAAINVSVESFFAEKDCINWIKISENRINDVIFNDVWLDANL